MQLIVCLDEQNGMLFNRRRQSKDRILRSQIVALCNGKRLWMNAYSARQFTVLPENVCVDEGFLTKAEASDYCFVENLDMIPYAEPVDSVTVYRWNRTYPADTWFPLDVVTLGMKLVSQRDFAGSSHEKITEEIYAR